ncbi:MAG: tail fiber domain-containing protein, partial [Bacteroidales bacterium]|nr:tail fiber domain-containing protein [Bacteroidales bacterium]
SDIKLKENIESIKYGLNEILQLKPVFFNFKDDKNKKKQIGLIAQEVQQVIPELVNKHEESGYLSIDYSKFVPVLINAIKDLKKEIDELKEENKTLNEKLKQLQTK